MLFKATIELRVNISEDRTGILKAAMQQCAKQLLAKAQLLSSDGKPAQIAMFGDDFMNGTQEIELVVVDESVISSE